MGPDQTVTRRKHASVGNFGGIITVTDLGSANGVCIYEADGTTRIGERLEKDHNTYIFLKNAKSDIEGTTTYWKFKKSAEARKKETVNLTVIQQPSVPVPSDKPQPCPSSWL